MKTAVCCISTYNHLHFALTLARSIRRCWAEQPTIFVLLVDHADLPRPGFEQLSDVRFVTLEELAIPDVAWLAVKFNAFEFTCACKPFLVRHALERGCDVAWYLDTDLLFLDDPATMREQAAEHDFVVTPHVFTALPPESVAVRPTLGHLAGAGVLNAGVFTARRGATALRFLEQWSALTVGVGACLPELGSTQEQNDFNWITAFAEDVHICRDRRMNVAYWNLHERPLRWAHLDGGRRDQWLLDGAPVRCFHFSGFRWEEQRLSRHDHRHPAQLNANLHALASHYDECLEAAGRAHYGGVAYGFARAGALGLSEEVRRYAKLLEVRERPDFGPQAPAPALLVDGLLALPGNRTLLPLLLEDVFLRRPALRALDPGETLFPRRFFGWCLRFLEPEYGERLPLFHGTLLAVHVAEREQLARRCASFLPEEPTDRLRDALVHRREEVKAALLRRRTALADPAPLDALLDDVAAGHHLILAFNPALALRLMASTWPALFAEVPSPAACPPSGFRAGVRAVVDRHFLWPDAHRAFLERLDPEASLARVLALIRRHPHHLKRLRAVGLRREVLASLTPLLAGQDVLDAADLALLDWHLGGAVGAAPPERGAPVLRRLLRSLFVPRAAQTQSALTAGSGDFSGPCPARLLPLLADDRDPRRWEGYLAWWAERNVGAAAGHARPAPPALAALVGAGDWRRFGELSPALAPEPKGVNLFGYFKSPIGLGQMSRGLRAALELNGSPCREIVLTNMTMASALRLEDLYPDFAFHYPRNLAVTYPHINYDLGEVFPESFFRGRETIGYLAWEQRDLHPEWARRLGFYDRLFALSHYTAAAVSRATERACQVLPCSVDVDVERARRYQRSDFDLRPEAFVAGVVFDATSSVERKNPLGAARALARAFHGRDDVTVVLKVNSGDRLPFRRGVAAVRAVLENAGIHVRLITHRMRRSEVEGLMAQLDLYVSLHRAEGFGYSLAEAMWLGVPVVATGYSGNMDFMREDNSHLVRYREVVLRCNEGPFQPGTVWAEPDVEHAAALCDLVYGDRAAARAKAERGARDVRSGFSVEAVAARLGALLA
ncbi:MAG TPA: glycosyltransferase [Candidatus Methanoperedens sp.]|nr:glycosyltransferase [Candidatus Methanoperedens sp.]